MADVQRLTDGAVVLDALTGDDVAPHLAGEDDEHARRFGWYPRRSTEATVRAAFERWRVDWATGGPTRAFATRDAGTGELVGGCQLRLRENRIAELSYWTFPERRNRGYARRAVRLACGFAVGELGVDRIEAYVEPDNAASRRVVEAAGFTEEGVTRARELTEHGERRDMVLYSLLASELE